jgi:SAM-dependent methyltransferase
MAATLPLTYAELVDEIVGLTDLPRAEVEHRVWQEALQIGWNVARDVERFGVRPHVYDANMERLYRDGDGFIFESLVHFARSRRQKWIAQALERVRRCAREAGVAPADLRILALGDGVGSDSLYLAANGCTVEYFDVPGSRTFDFALRRFERYGMLNTRIHVLAEDPLRGSRRYDVVLSFEVLEHLSQPPAAAGGIAAIVRPGGLALVTESFSAVNDQFPTHLAANARYEGQTPFLFLRHGLALSWYSTDPLFKPMEFRKAGGPRRSHTMRLLADVRVMRAYQHGVRRHLASKLRRGR